MIESEIVELVVQLVMVSAIIGVTLAVLEAFFGSGR